MTDQLAIAYVPRAGRAESVPAPEASEPGPGEVLVSTMHVGFCGTDREIVRGGIAVLDDGADRLILGHEMVGVVSEVGPGTELEAGTLVVPTVRRGCGCCEPCNRGRSDFCLSGSYREHGITRLDGFARPQLVLAADVLVAVPVELGHLAVLTEPLSIVEKALEQARYVAARIPGNDDLGRGWGTGRRALVAGAGPIGLLTTYLLTEAAFEVDVLDLLDPDALAPQLARSAGATYRQVERAGLGETRNADIVVEATGDPRVAFDLLGALRPGGVLVWLGAPDPTVRAEIEIGRSMLDAVLGHHAVVASINSARLHFEQAIDDLAVLARRPRFDELVTGIFPPDRFAEALWPRGPSIKQVVSFVDGSGMIGQEFDALASNTFVKNPVEPGEEA